VSNPKHRKPRCPAALAARTYYWTETNTLTQASVIVFSCSKPEGHAGPRAAPRADRPGECLPLPPDASVEMHQVTWPNRQGGAPCQ